MSPEAKVNRAQRRSRDLQLRWRRGRRVKRIIKQPNPKEES